MKFGVGISLNEGTFYYFSHILKIKFKGNGFIDPTLKNRIFICNIIFSVICGQ